MRTAEDDVTTETQGYQMEDMERTILHRPNAPHDSSHPIFAVELLKHLLEYRDTVVLFRLRRTSTFGALRLLRPF